MLRNRVIPILLHSVDGLVKTTKFKDPIYIGVRKSRGSSIFGYVNQKTRQRFHHKGVQKRNPHTDIRKLEIKSPQELSIGSFERTDSQSTHAV